MAAVAADVLTSMSTLDLTSSFMTARNAQSLAGGTRRRADTEGKAAYPRRIECVGPRTQRSRRGNAGLAQECRAHAGRAALSVVAREGSGTPACSRDSKGAGDHSL